MLETAALTHSLFCHVWNSGVTQFHHVLCVSYTAHGTRPGENVCGFSRILKWPQWPGEKQRLFPGISRAAERSLGEAGNFLSASSWIFQEFSIPWNVESSDEYIINGTFQTFSRSQPRPRQRVSKHWSCYVIRLSFIRNTSYFVPMTANTAVALKKTNRSVDRYVEKPMNTLI